MDARSLFSAHALDGPPLFFPDPPAPVTFNFDQGIAAQETFPIEELKQLAAQVLDRDQARALEYISFDHDPETGNVIYLPSYVELVLGHTGLRQELARWIGNRQGVDGLAADSFIATSGSVQAIALAAAAFVDQGEGVLVESASFPYATRFFQMRGADVRTVDIDGDGLMVDSLEARLAEFARDGVRPKLLYVIPTFQLPTCAVLPVDRRRRLLEVAERWDLVVVEDGIYQDLRYEGDPVPSLLSLDSSGRVIQSHGFSKIMAPALRLGWMAGRPEMIEGLAAVRQDLGVSQWLCRLMAAYLAADRMDAHLDAANEVYRRKRDIAVAAVREHCGEWVDFAVPKGGFYLWLRMRDGVDWEKAQHEAALNGVFCRPGEKFTDSADSGRFLRLAFSHAPGHELRRGIEALGSAISHAAR